MLDYFEPKRKRGRPRGSRKKKEELAMFVTEKTTRTKSSGEKVENHELQSQWNLMMLAFWQCR
eukprot:3040135-Ditylum_brightwellii.AAC.1